MCPFKWCNPRFSFQLLSFSWKPLLQTGDAESVGCPLSAASLEDFTHAAAVKRCKTSRAESLSSLLLERLWRFAAHILARKAMSSSSEHFMQMLVLFHKKSENLSLKVFLSFCLCGSARPGRLPPAVHQDLWEGESRGGPTAAYHPPGAGGFGSVQDRPPGAHTGGCGLTLCSGEFKLPMLSSPCSVPTSKSLRPLLLDEVSVAHLVPPQLVKYFQNSLD